MNPTTSEGGSFVHGVAEGDVRLWSDFHYRGLNPKP